MKKSIIPSSVERELERIQGLPVETRKEVLEMYLENSNGFVDENDYRYGRIFYLTETVLGTVHIMEELMKTTPCPEGLTSTTLRELRNKMMHVIVKRGFTKLI